MKPRILVTGASGYIGGRLIRSIDPERFELRCIARKPEVVRRRHDGPLEVFEADVLDEASLREALAGVDIACYLVHAMASHGDFEELDRAGAHNFGRAAQECGVKRIVYLGGLGEKHDDLSDHLASRHEVGDILRSYAAEVIEFRASIILGSGSLSFEMIRALTERLPVMLTPKWVSVPAQPISIEDVLAYLTASLDLQYEGNRIYEVGGSDVVSYGDLMRCYASLRKLHRVMIPVPVLTPWLSSLWLAIFTPIYQRVGRRLVQSIKYPTIVTEHCAERDFQVRPMSVRTAMERALSTEDREFAESTWADALSSAGKRTEWGGTRFGNRLVDSRVHTVAASAERTFAVIRRIGGINGWYYADRLWGLRGFLDKIAGGVGMGRGRRDPEYLREGDVVDCWRVEKIEENRLVRFAAEMKLPGRAWLEFELTEQGNRTVIRQTASFDPVGLFGLVYWYSLFPVHQFIFSGMIGAIANRARASVDRREEIRYA